VGALAAAGKAVRVFSLSLIGVKYICRRCEPGFFIWDGQYNSGDIIWLCANMVVVATALKRRFSKLSSVAARADDGKYLVVCEVIVHTI
jgi:hypothetical protein